MKKMTLLSVAVAALLFVGCGGEKTTENNTTTEVNTTTTEVNTTTTEANATEATATEANTTTDAAPAADGKTAFAACGACHGADGKTLALGKSPVIAGQAKDVLVTKMKGYKDGSINLTGNGPVMQGQMANLNDEQIEALAEYISKL